MKKLINYFSFDRKSFKANSLAILVILFLINVYMIHSLRILPVVLIVFWYSFRNFHKMWYLNKKCIFLFDCVCSLIVLFLLLSFWDNLPSFEFQQSIIISLENVLSKIRSLTSLHNYAYFYTHQMEHDESSNFLDFSNKVLYAKVPKSQHNLPKTLISRAASSSSTSTAVFSIESPTIVKTLVSRYSHWITDYKFNRPPKPVIESLLSTSSLEKYKVLSSQALLTELMQQNEIMASIPKSSYSIATPNFRFSILMHSHSKNEIPSLFTSFTMSKDISKMDDCVINPHSPIPYFNALPNHSSIAFLFNAEDERNASVAISMATHSAQRDYFGCVSPEFDFLNNGRAQHFTKPVCVDNVRGVITSKFHSQIIDFLSKRHDNLNFVCARLDSQHQLNLHVWSASSEQTHYMSDALALLEYSLRENPEQQIDHIWLNTFVFAEYLQKPNANVDFVENTIKKILEIVDMHTKKEIPEIS